MHEINLKNLLGDIWVILKMLGSRTFLLLSIFWNLDDTVMDQGVFWFQNWFETRKYIIWSLLSVGLIFEKQLFDSQNFWDRIWKTSPFFWDTLYISETWIKWKWKSSRRMTINLFITHWILCWSCLQEICSNKCNLKIHIFATFNCDD